MNISISFWADPTEAAPDPEVQRFEMDTTNAALFLNHLDSFLFNTVGALPSYRQALEANKTLTAKIEEMQKAAVGPKPVENPDGGVA